MLIATGSGALLTVSTMYTQAGPSFKFNADVLGKKIEQTFELESHKYPHHVAGSR